MLVTLLLTAALATTAAPRFDATQMMKLKRLADPQQGLSMFTALQLRGVASRLVVFPDENHWVLKPANSVRWYQEVLGWLDRWTTAR